MNNKLLKTLSLLFALVMLLAAVGCDSGRTNTPDPTAQPETTQSAEVQPTEAQATDAPKDGDHMGKPFDDSFDMALVNGDKVYPIHTDAAPVIADLGDNYQYSEAISCTRDGMEKTYEYDGLRIDTLPTDNGDIIGLFVITGGSYKTPRGIGVGSTKDELFAAYGDYYYDDYYYVFTKSNDPENITDMRLQIVVENDVVVEINIYAPDYGN